MTIQWDGLQHALCSTELVYGREIILSDANDSFHTRAKCVIWIIIWIAHSEWSFERQYFGPCVCQITSWCVIEMRLSNDRAEVFSSYASRKSCSKITVWMPWPLKCDLRGGAMWPSNHFRLYTACCICTEAHEIRAPCMFDWQGTQTFFSRSGMLNPKFGLSCVHCVIQNVQFKWYALFKLCTLLSCENSQWWWSIVPVTPAFFPPCKSILEINYPDKRELE